MELILLSDMQIKDGKLINDVEVDSNWIYSQELLDEYVANGDLYVTEDLYFRRIVNDPRYKKMRDILPSSLSERGNSNKTSMVNYQNEQKI